MKNDILIINFAAAILLIGATMTYFAIGPNAATTESKKLITITIENHAYQPALIEIPSGKAATLHFVRQDTSVCKTSIQFPQFNTSYSFVMNKPIDIDLPPFKPGSIDFNCPDSELHGRIIVV